MTTRPSPPPPPGDLKPDSPWLQKWYWDVWKWVRGLAGAFTELDFTGSNLTSIATRNHNDLQTIQGGTATERYHLTAAQVALIGEGGGVAWQPAQTANLTAGANRGYPINSTSGPVTVGMPPAPVVGDVVAVLDAYQQARTNNITINGNGARLCGQDAEIVLQEAGQSVAFVYVDATRGWMIFEASALDNYPVSGTGAPTTTDILNGQDVIWNDMAGGTVKHYANVNGSLVSVTLN